MDVRAVQGPPEQTGADTIVYGTFEGEPIATPALQALLDGGEAKAQEGHVALAHVDGHRQLLVGLGKREEFDAERARVAAAKAVRRALELGCSSLCWTVPAGAGVRGTGALVEGTILASYSFRRYKTDVDEPERPIEVLTLCTEVDQTAAVARAAVVAEAANAARALQDTPPTT